MSSSVRNDEYLEKYGSVLRDGMARLNRH